MIPREIIGMAEQSDFPKLIVESGVYAAEWEWAGKEFAGELGLERDSPPKIGILGEPPERASKSRRAFPERLDVDELRGRLRMGQDVVLSEVGLSTWFPGRTNGYGRYALVGLGIRDVAGQAYRQARLQISGLDAWISRVPLSSVRFPTDAETWVGQEFGATVSEESSLEWKADGVSLSCSYEARFSGFDGYRMELTLAPVIDIEVQDRLRVSQWIDAWLMPLVHLASFATKSPQNLAWVRFLDINDEKEQRSRRAAQLFGSGITQSPFTAERPDFRGDEQRRPLFTLVDLQDSPSLPKVVERWSVLLRDGNPFLELYRSVLFDPELPPRARLLYLLQALESLDASEQSDMEEKRLNAYVKRRVALLERLEGKLSREDMQFINAALPKRPMESLTERIRRLMSKVKSDISKRLDDLKTSTIGLELMASGAQSSEDMLRVLRNHLSHATRVYESEALLPWVDAIEDFARAQLMRLLGIAAERSELSAPTQA